MWRPFVVYRQLAAAPPVGGWRAARRPLLLQLSIACFVSWTSTGALVVDHLILSLPSWAFVPALQALMVIVAARAVRSRRPVASLVDLYFRGHLPWMLLITLLSLLCLIPDGTLAAFSWLLDSGVLVAAVAIAVGWCAWLSYAFFRAGLDLGRVRAALACAGFYCGVIGLGTSYYLITNQLQPLLGILP